MKKGLRTTGKILFVAGALLAAQSIEKEETTEIPLEIPMEEIREKPNILGKIEERPAQIPDAPQYDYRKARCAAYAVRTAKEIFGRTFTEANAWNMRYQNPVLSEVKDKAHLNDLIENGIVQPGRILGVSYPESDYLDEKDAKGNPAKYTHMVVYAGKSREGEPMFYHQFFSDEEKISLSDLEETVGSPVEVLGEWN
tara:strand:- start:1216 stop:1806 length:591 start_codon:yes stop_codon:yes gene_type:complete